MYRAFEQRNESVGGSLPGRWNVLTNAMLYPVVHGAYEGRHPYETMPNLQEAMAEYYGMIFSVEFGW